MCERCVNVTACRKGTRKEREGGSDVREKSVGKTKQKAGVKCTKERLTEAEIR